MAQTRKYYLKNNYLTSRSKFHEGHFGTGTTALWSCIHIPNIIDLYGKKKVMVRTSFAEKQKQKQKKWKQKKSD